MGAKGRYFEGSWLDLFVPFIIGEIARAAGRGRNPIMTNLVKKFMEKHKNYQSPCAVYNGVGYPVGPNFSTLNIYGIEIRKYLEVQGYISYPFNYGGDRRLRPLTPTPKFPTHKERSRVFRLSSVTFTDVNTTLYQKMQQRQKRRKK